MGYKWWFCYVLFGVLVVLVFWGFPIWKRILIHLILKGTPLQIPKTHQPSNHQPLNHWQMPSEKNNNNRRFVDASAGRCSRTTTDAYCHFGFGLTTGQSFGTGGSFCCFVAIFSSWWQLKYSFNVHPYILGVSWSHFWRRRIFFPLGWVETTN